MTYSVSRYLDQIREVSKPELKDGQMGCNAVAFFFTTEQAARKHIINRAEGALLDAQEAVKLAEKRLRKCKRKFGEA